MKEKIEKYEKLILRNLTIIAGGIIIIILLLFFIQQIFCVIDKIFETKILIKTIDLQFTLTSIGAIFVFWYGYKTYERNKELEIIDKYTEKYNLINSKINNLILQGKDIGDELEEGYSDLLNLWYEEYYLFQKGYITKSLWKEWDYWIFFDLVEAFHYDSDISIKNKEGYTPIFKSLMKYQRKMFINNEGTNNEFTVYLFDKVYRFFDGYENLQFKLLESKTISQKEFKAKILWYNSIPVSIKLRLK